MSNIDNSGDRIEEVETPKILKVTKQELLEVKSGYPYTILRPFDEFSKGDLVVVVADGADKIEVLVTSKTEYSKDQAAVELKIKR